MKSQSFKMLKIKKKLPKLIDFMNNIVGKKLNLVKFVSFLKNRYNVK